MSIVHEDADLLNGPGQLGGATAQDNAPHNGSDVGFSMKHNKSIAAGLTAAVEQYAAAAESDRRAAFRVLVERMKEAKDAGHFEELAVALSLALVPTLDFTSAQSLN